MKRFAKLSLCTIRYPRRFVLLHLSLGAALASARIANGDELKAYACGPADRRHALMTIVLPADWSYEPGNARSGRLQKYVFTHSSGPYPYLWTEIEESSAQTLDLRLKQAEENPYRDLFSGGSTGESYYDSGRKALWTREKNNHGTGSVTVTMFHQHVVTFRFFDKRTHLSELEPQILAIVDNVRFHLSNENVAASTEPVSIPAGVDASSFRRTSVSSGFPYLPCLATAVVIATLATIEFRIRRNRHLANVAEIEQAKEARQKQERAREMRENRDAAAYLKAASGRTHLRRE